MLTSLTTQIAQTLPSIVRAFDPLEQFELTAVLTILNCIVLNNLALTWIVALAVLWTALFTYSLAAQTAYAYVTRAIQSLVASIRRENIYIQKQQYFPVRFFLFSTLLLANLIGLLPYAFTVTSSFAVTFFIALTHFIGINLIGCTAHRWQLRNLFLPAGAPLAIAPFLILIERVSYLARVLSLSIRLFANRRSGHALLKILIGFALVRGSSSDLFLNFVATRPWAVVTVVRFLELLIAFLQAYVFTILISLYVNDTLTLH